MIRLLFPLLIGLMTALPAEAGRRSALEGRIYVAIADAEVVARADTAGLFVTIGQLFGMDIPREVCEGTAEEIKATINNPADPDFYVPSEVQCELVHFETEWYWWHLTAGGTTVEAVNAPSGTYLVAAVDVIDPEAVASARKGRRKVRMAKALGVSVEGRVNEELMLGILETMKKRGIDAFVTAY